MVPSFAILARRFGAAWMVVSNPWPRLIVTVPPAPWRVHFAPIEDAD